LIASDMASEGLNLHFQSHRLIHFDLPWSLLRFQQRNGRIDRYGQDRPPQIYYFVGESAHPKVRDMWVLEKLVEKDEAAQRGVGDPAVFLGKGDAELEEEVVANAVALGIGAEKFADEMDARVANAHERASLDDAYDMLFGDYSGQQAPPMIDVWHGGQPPRLFADTFTYAAQMLHRLEARHDGLIAGKPGVDAAERLIHFALPDDMKSDGGLGYTRREDVDEKYMPVEAVQGGQIRLTDNRDVIDTAIDRARTDEKAWPSTQFLWDGHPILSWFSDRSDIFFPDRSIPYCSLEGRLAKAETCILIHGAVPNEVGAPVVDVWGVVVVFDGRVERIESVSDFITRSRLAGQTPNSGIDRDLGVFQDVVALSVNAFQSHLVDIRKQREAEIEKGLDETLGRLSALQGRFMNQIELDLGGSADEAITSSGNQKRRVQRKENRTRDVNEIFDDWASWFQRNRTMVKDPNPYVEVKAVFAG
jgi:hypothetical protein